MAGDPLPPAPPLALERPHERAEVCACHATAIIEFFTCASLSFSSRPRMPSKFSYVLRLPLGGLVLLLAELHGVVLHHLGLDLGLLFDTWARVRVRTGVRAASHKKLANLRGITPDHLNAMTSNFDDIPPTRCRLDDPYFRFF